MAHSGSKVVIFAAIIGNLAIAVTKFIAAYITKSSAMLSEGIHSVVDTGNGMLLLLGMREATKPADENHPFGRGKELYFYALIVAIIIFALGGGISLYEGILHALHPAPMHNPKVNYIVLGLSMFFEGISWTIAFREFKKMKGDRGYIQTIHESKDPTTFTVFIEDSAAMMGLVVALIGVTLAHQLEMPIFDGLASIAIGLILAGVAVFLTYETKSLLIGESANSVVIAEIRAIAEADVSVSRFVRARTMHFGPHEVLVTMDLLFNPNMTTSELSEGIDRLEKNIREKHPECKYIYLESKSVGREAKD